MRTRIVVGVLLALLFLLTLFFGGVVQCVMFSLATSICVYEMVKTFQKKGLNPFSYPLYLFALIYYPVTRYTPAIYWLLLLLVFCVTATIVERIFNKKRTTEDVFASLSVFLYPLSFFVFIAAIHKLSGEPLSRIALLMMFAGPLLGDTMAYFIGVFHGRHKLCPHISPKKTVEGSIGGLAGGIMGGILVYFVQQYLDIRPYVGIIPMMVLGLLCGAMGQIGDLFASTIKRWADIKDFGTFLPGHGGMLDRLDSVLMCAPMVFLFFYAVHSYVTGLL